MREVTSSALKFTQKYDTLRMAKTILGRKNGRKLEDLHSKFETYYEVIKTGRHCHADRRRDYWDRTESAHRATPVSSTDIFVQKYKGNSVEKNHLFNISY